MAHATRYCPTCGLERRQGERFCRNCGSALGTGQTGLHESPTMPPPFAVPPVAVPPQAPPPAADQVVPQAAQTPQPVQAQPVTPLPAPPVAPPAAGSQPRASNLPYRPFALIGGGLLVVAAFLPWLSIDGLGSTSALDVPVQALWDLNAGDGPIKIGFVTIALGVLGAGLSFLPRTATIRRLCGSFALAVAAAFLLQSFRAFEQAGGSLGDFVGAIGIGVYLTIVGAFGLQMSR